MKETLKNAVENDMQLSFFKLDDPLLEDIKEEISTLSRLGTLLKAILFPASFIQKSYFKKVAFFVLFLLIKKKS